MIHILLLVPTILIIRHIVAEWRAADIAETPVSRAASLPIIIRPARHKSLTFANQNNRPEIPQIIFTNKLMNSNSPLLSAR